MSSIGVMHLIDALEAGGAERMAVNIANHLPHDKYRAFLCTTRAEGPLAASIQSHVGRLSLERRGRVDLPAIGRLRRFVRDNRIRILHAHSTSLFVAAVAARFQDVRIVWHVHYGKLVGTSSVLPYRIASHGISGVIAVSDVLAAWSRYHLHVPAGRVWYVPNFAELPSAAVCPDLPGRKGFRIAHVANLRPEKDHPTLLQAFAVVASALPDAHLLLAGGAPDLNYRNSLIRLIDTLGLGGRVTMLGSRTDISDVLAQCDVGVLSSISEGLPVSLIEYGVAGLAAVATTVGQSSEVLDGGTAGVLVPSGDTAALAEAILSLLQSPARRSELGRRLHERVKSRYSPQAVIGQISDIYETVLRN